MKYLIQIDYRPHRVILSDDLLSERRFKLLQLAAVARRIES